jgi:hypothetical protein
MNPNWSELDDSLRIERMRSIVKRQGRAIERMERTISSLRHHQHTASGDIVVPLGGEYYGEAEESSGLQEGKDEVYF